MKYCKSGSKYPLYPSKNLEGETAAYHEVSVSRKIEVNPSDQVRPFSEIDRLLSWYYHPKHALR